MSEPGPRVVVTRSEAQAASFGRRLTAAGFSPLLFPVISFAPLPPAPLDAALRRAAVYDWLIFTSVNAVQFFFERVDARGVQLGDLRVAAVGSATAAALSRRGITPDFMPDEYTGAQLARGLGDLRGQCALLPRARRGRPEIVQLLRKQGAAVDDIPLYDTVTATPAPEALALLGSGFEALTFTSPSSVRNFFKIVGEQSAEMAARLRRLVNGAVIVCIGPVTAAAASGFGIGNALIPDDYTIDGLVDALCSRFFTGESHE